MRRSFAVTALTAAFVLATLAHCPPVHGAEPEATLPPVPPLIVGAPAPAPQSFVVDGLVRSSADTALGFRVARDGERQFCALFDAADGTPMFVSDGLQTLLYDLAENRILWVPSCRANVRLDWDGKSDKPLNFSFKFEVKHDPKQLDEANAWFRIDRFVEASAAELKRVEAPAGSVIWAAERKSGAIESVQMNPADPTWFSFRSLVKGKEYYPAELHATGIGRPTPAAALAFPDVAKLAKQVPVEPFDLKAKPALIEAFSSGRCFTPKLALAGQNAEEILKRILPKVDITALRAQDARFSAKYRAALAAQKVTFPRLKSGNSATQPTGAATTQSSQ